MAMHACLLHDWGYFYRCIFFSWCNLLFVEAQMYGEFLQLGRFM